MAEEKASDWKRFPWQKAIIALLSAIVALSGYIMKTQYDRVNNWKVSYEKQEHLIAKKDSLILKCNQDQLDYLRNKDERNDSMLRAPVKELLKTINK